MISITDGDTIWVDILGEESRVRYIGIDTPEIGFDDRPAEPYAEEATTANAALVEAEVVVLETDVSETDDFGRLLRYVWLAPDDTADSGTGTWRLVNLELVEPAWPRPVTTRPTPSTRSSWTTPSQRPAPPAAASGATSS